MEVGVNDPRFGIGRTSAKANDDRLNQEWSRNTWQMIAESGTWAVPRSGLVFQKREGKLHLIEMMPHMPGMPLNEKELRTYQDEDFDSIQEEFAKVGVEVVRDV